MRRILFFVLLCVCAPVVFVHLVSAQVIQGIVIKESSFDPQTKTVKLTFINDRPRDLTAYHYCISVQSTDPDSNRRDCVLIDTADYTNRWNADLRRRPYLAKFDRADACSNPNCNPVHPGQERVITTEVGGNRVFSATVTIDMVAWDDQTYQGSSKQLQVLINDRKTSMNTHLMVAKTIREALELPEPLMMDHVLQTIEREHKDSEFPKNVDLMVVLGELRQPNREKGDLNEGAPEKPREFLKLSLPFHEFVAAEFAKQLNFRPAGEQ